MNKGTDKFTKTTIKQDREPSRLACLSNITGLLIISRDRGPAKFK